DDVEHGLELPQRRVAPPLANHFAERVLQPRVLHLEGRQHEVVLALEVLVERRLADPHVRQDLIDSDIAKPVAIKAPDGPFDEPLSGCRRHRNRSRKAKTPQVYLKSTRKCTTSQLAELWRHVINVDMTCVRAHLAPAREAASHFPRREQGQ